MKNLMMCALTATLLLTFNLSPSAAFSTPGQPGTPVAGTARSLKVNALTTRLYDIKMLDKSGMSAAEKRHLRKEARSLRGEMKQLNGGVYLSAGAIILIVVLLIILL